MDLGGGEISMSSAISCNGKLNTKGFLRCIGVKELPARTSPFDPGYDPMTLESHLEQSCQFMSILKISMACWLIANEESTRRKIRAARKAGVPTVTGGGPWLMWKSRRLAISVLGVGYPRASYLLLL